MPDEKHVLIAHDDGREYGIRLADFTNPKVSPDRQTYADQGFRIVSYEEGTPYEGPKTKREIERAAQERQAARDVPKVADKPAPKLDR